MKQFTKILFSFSILLTFNISTSSVKADADDNSYDNEIGQIYQHGKDKGVINDDNMSYAQFDLLMKNSVIPAYENNKNNSSNLNKNLDEFTSDDNYEVAPGQDENTETDISGNDDDDSLFKIKASKSYQMEPGDILIGYGMNSNSFNSNSIKEIGKDMSESFSGTLIGHAAIAISNNEILEMPGPPTPGATMTPKSTFFNNHASKAKDGKYVAVYRVKNKQYASDAAKYAYNNMYLGKTNPSYWLNPNLKDKMHSYCSKYVLLAYYNSNPQSINPLLIQEYGGAVHPHLLQNEFLQKTELSTVTSY